MALHCRVKIISSTPTAAQRLVEILGAALDTEGAWHPEAEAGIVQLGANTSLEVRALSSGLLAAARQLRFRGQPALSRLAGVAIQEAGAGGAASAPSSVVAPLSVSPGWQEWQEWLSEARPRVTPALSFVSGGSKQQQGQHEQQPSPSLLREVVLGATYTDLAGMAARLNGVGRPVVGRPNVFWLRPGSLALRLLPSTMSSLVLRAPTPTGGMAEVREHMERRGVAAYPIGLTGASVGQLQLSAPELDGLDVRISLSPEGEVPGWFAEGSEVLRENVIEELNPSIDGPVHHVGEGAAASVPAAHYQRTMGGIGNCWSEFRAQLRRPGGFMKK